MRKTIVKTYLGFHVGRHADHYHQHCKYIGEKFAAANCRRIYHGWNRFIYSDSYHVPNSQFASGKLIEIIKLLLNGRDSAWLKRFGRRSCPSLKVGMGDRTFFDGVTPLIIFVWTG